MLIPAICKKDEIIDAMHKLYYTDDMFFYVGGLGSWVAEIPEDNDSRTFKWASVDNEGNLIGYIAYQIDWYAECAYNFGLFSFDKGNLTVARDLDTVMEALVGTKSIHRIEWRGVSGNHALKAYDRFCKKYNGYRHVFHDAVKDARGDFHDEIVYEIIINRNSEEK